MNLLRLRDCNNRTIGAVFGDGATVVIVIGIVIFNLKKKERKKRIFIQNNNAN